MHAKRDIINFKFSQFILKDMIFYKQLQTHIYLYTKSKLTKKGIIRYQFQAQVMTDDGEIAYQSHEP